MRSRVPRLGSMVALMLTAAACSESPARDTSQQSARPVAAATPSEVTLAFAGDVHFEAHLAGLLGTPEQALADVAPVLGDADLTMVNLETAITGRGDPEPKRYRFRTGPAALDVLAAAGVDLVSLGNNHGADYGEEGLRDTLAVKEQSPIPIVGVGADSAEAFEPYRVTVRGTRLAFFGADTIPLESATTASIWNAGPGQPGLAAARDPQAARLVEAVRSASAAGDVVVVYLHWGEENVACPAPRQRMLARMLAEAGADVVVGSHSHVLLASGWLGKTYISYGLANFVWYHARSPETGVLKLTLRDGAVVADEWTPARIQPEGIPRPLEGGARTDAMAAYDSLRGCADLRRRSPGSPPPAPTDLPPYDASARPLDDAVIARMGASHRAGCPVPLTELVYLRVPYVGFDGLAHRGELVVHRRHATDILAVFEKLYAARWPIYRMRLVDEYGADEDRTLAANNTSAFNCRRVVDADTWSDHAFGAAIDINPVQNPYLLPDRYLPPSGKGFAALDRSPGAKLPMGTIARSDVVVDAFAQIGWAWGGDFSDPDFQHFYAAS